MEEEDLCTICKILDKGFVFAVAVAVVMQVIFLIFLMVLGQSGTCI